MKEEKWYSGIVTHGLENGRTFGFRTANIADIYPEMTVDNGVYAVKIQLNNDYFYGMLYIGTRPTLQLTERSIEIHIFDFQKNIYSQKILFSINKKIRDEQYFSSNEKLIEQIEKDAELIRQFFRLPPPQFRL